MADGSRRSHRDEGRDVELSMVEPKEGNKRMIVTTTARGVNNRFDLKAETRLIPGRESIRAETM